MKARIPKHREFIINFPDSIDNAKANEGWAKLQQIVEDYKKAHNGASVYAPTFIEDCEPEVRSCRKSTASSTPSVRSVSSEFSVYCIKKSRAFQPAGWNALLFLLLISVPY